MGEANTLPSQMEQLPRESLLVGRWYVGRGRNGNLGRWDGEDFLVIGEERGDLRVKREPYYAEESGCFQPFRAVDEGTMLEPFGSTGWDAHYGRRMAFGLAPDATPAAGLANVWKALLRAAAECTGTSNPKRSRKFVEKLAEAFREDSKGMVFDRSYGDHRRDFGLNEFLHDILVCDAGDCASANGHRLRFVQRPLWQIESEFSTSTRHAIHDFNKLVLGGAPFKLFIGPTTSERTREGFREALLPVARACSGWVFLALLPPPNEWERWAGRTREEQAESVAFFRLSPQRWEPELVPRPQQS